MLINSFIHVKAPPTLYRIFKYLLLSKYKVCILFCAINVCTWSIYKLLCNYELLSYTLIDLENFLCYVSGHGLKSIDLVCMKKLDTKVNIIPIIAKADTISKTELQKFKVRLLCVIL